MKRLNKIILAFLIILSFTAVKAQNIVNIKHTYYTISYDTTLKAPLMVYYLQTKKHALSTIDIDRKLVASFLKDTSVNSEHQADYSDYKHYNSSHSDKLDRGHLAPYSAFDFDTLAAIESMYYTNTAPQHYYLNRYPWMRLEQYILRKLATKYDTIYTWTGCIYGNKYMNDIAIPEYFWKIVYYDGKYKAWIAKNDNSKNKDYRKYEIPIKDLLLIIRKKYPQLLH